MEELRTSRTLLARIRDLENAEAWERFVEIYEPMVLRFTLWRGLDRTDAADITQEVMAAVAAAIRGFEYDPAKGSFRGWLLTVTRRKISGLARTRRRRPQTVPADDNSYERLEAASPAETDVWETEYRRRLFDWACGLVRGSFSETSWRAFWMTTVEGRGGEETAAALGMKPGAVYVAKGRVLQRVREKIASVADEWDVSPPDPGPASAV